MKAKADVVVVTGASGGIGRATALAFAQNGSRVALLARGEAGLAGAQREIENVGGRALPIAVDVADADAVERAAARVEQELGPIDVWVNAAMATIFGPVSSLGADEYRRATEVTYLGTVYGTMSALRRMQPRNRGAIVQVGSALAYRAIPLQAPYCGAKYAIRGFTDALRVELMHENSDVQLTMVQLSAFNTPQFNWARSHMPRRAQPVPPIFQPEVAARAIVWAAGHRRRELHVGWPAVKAIWGNKIMPWLADRMLVRSGFSGQLTSEPQPADAPDNLYAPVDYDGGTHGRFDARARSRSLQTEWTVRRPPRTQR
ncbi:SDR family oxidoreductase [Solimonas marina]|uniref:SDR family oxidoreductase n=1 Tax=Solimonas marina TaxID=2714601 RepID=A0A969WDU6_9GAMM|nr:SDR family oxidoreductase [Solimonas marina]NKF24394.1 SDR family oxidoreductase [Solimonas marina]